MTNGNVLTFNMENFLGVVEFNGSKIYREIKLDDGILSIQDKDYNHTTLGEKKPMVSKINFQKGIKDLVED